MVTERSAGVATMGRTSSLAIPRGVKVKLGISFANTGPFSEPEAAVALARAAEELGIDTLWTVEHIIWPSEYSSTYPYHPSGKMPGDPATPLPDPLIWLAWVAAHTSTVRLATGILLLPERNPLITAKEVATLDRLSGGRALLGIGIGWLREEFAALGIPFADRAARTDEYVACIRALWAGDEVDFDGRFVSFAGVSSNPKPVGGSVPVYVGGHSPAAAKRAGRLGDGFFPARGSITQMGELFAIAREAASAAGRDPGAIEMCAPPPSGTRHLAEELAELEAVGCEHAVLPAFLFRKPDPATALRTALGPMLG